MSKTQSITASRRDEAEWIRRLKYMEKLGIGSTTFAKWKKLGLIETRDIGNMTFVRDQLPESTVK
jgi:hypothetical protein